MSGKYMCDDKNRIWRDDGGSYTHVASVRGRGAVTFYRSVSSRQDWVKLRDLIDERIKAMEETK